jgi:hypothetical protein
MKRIKRNSKCRKIRFLLKKKKKKKKKKMMLFEGSNGSSKFIITIMIMEDCIKMR